MPVAAPAPWALRPRSAAGSDGGRPYAPRRSSDSAPRECCASGGVALDTGATSTSRTSSAMSCRSSRPQARSRREWGSTAAARPVRAIAASHRRRRQRGTWSTRATTASRSSTRRQLHHGMGPSRQRLGQFSFHVPELHAPPGGASRRGNHVYVRRQRQHRIERFTWKAARSDAVGIPWKRPGAVYYPRASRPMKARWSCDDEQPPMRLRP